LVEEVQTFLGSAKAQTFAPPEKCCLNLLDSV